MEKLKKIYLLKKTTHTIPASPYAISKVGTDLLGKYYADAYGLNTQITRMFTHGPRRSEFFAESTFAKQIVMIEKNNTTNNLCKNLNL